MRKYYAESAATDDTKKEKTEVVITDINIPFVSMIRLIFRFLVALIPVGLIFAVLYGLFYMILSATVYK